MPTSPSLTAHIEVKDSSIHGKGLFAAAPLPGESFVGEYQGEPTEEDGTYVLWVEKEVGGDVRGIDGRNEFRFLNHSSEPNVEFDGSRLYTLRPIAPGEELTFHYGEEWD